MFDSISIYLRIGMRNLWLHPARTALTMAALAIGIGALTFLTAMNDGWMQNIRRNFVLTETGHLQIHARGFALSQQISDHITDDSALLPILNATPAIQAWSERVRASGIAAAAGSNAGALIYGVDPHAETEVSRLRSFVTQGRWLHRDDHGVVLGDVLADRLQLALGDKVVLMAAAPDGEIVSELFRVRGLLHSGVMDLDNLAAIITIDRARHWLGLAPHSATDIVIRAHHFDQVNSIQHHLQSAMQGKGVEVQRWMDIDPMAEQWSAFSDAYTWIVLAIVIIVVLVEVLNTMLMSMHDRVREFGLMGALGTSRQQIFVMVVWETVILVAAGSTLGFALGGWISWWYGIHGLDLSQWAVAFSFMYLSPIVYPQLSWSGCAAIIGAATTGALIAGIYPAWKAARLDPAAAMRTM